MPSFETPHAADTEPRKKASFELGGVSVPVEEFATHPAEAAEVMHEAKERQEELEAFYTHTEEALANVESLLPATSGEQASVDGAGRESAPNVPEKLSVEDDNGAFLLKIASLAERIPGGKNALGALALVIGLSSLPKNAEAFSLDPIQVASKEVERGVNGGVRGASRDTGRAVGGVIEQAVGALRKSIGLETPQERAKRENEERRAENELKRQHEKEVRSFSQEQVQRVREDTREVMNFERTTDQYQRKLEDVRRSFNQEFDRAQASYVQQRDRVGSPEQAKRYEREQWQRWLQAARSGVQKLEQYDHEIDNAEADVSGVVSGLAQRAAEAQRERGELLRSSAEMRQALSELAAKMERNLGITENAQSPLRKIGGNNASRNESPQVERSSDKEKLRNVEIYGFKPSPAESLLIKSQLQKLVPGYLSAKISVNKGSISGIGAVIWMKIEVVASNGDSFFAKGSPVIPGGNLSDHDIMLQEMFEDLAGKVDNTDSEQTHEQGDGGKLPWSSGSERSSDNNSSSDKDWNKIDPMYRF